MHEGPGGTTGAPRKAGGLRSGAGDHVNDVVRRMFRTSGFQVHKGSSLRPTGPHGALRKGSNLGHVNGRLGKDPRGIIEGVGMSCDKCSRAKRVDRAAHWRVVSYVPNKDIHAWKMRSQYATQLDDDQDTVVEIGK